MKIQTYTADKAKEIADLFHQSVHAIDPSIYNIEQQEAWAPMPPDYSRWAERLSLKQPFVALVDNRVAGFIELDVDGHIDCTYTHPEYQGQGIATALYQHLEAEAKKRKLDRLYVEASTIAKPFFERHRSSLIRANKVQRNGVTFINYTMEKYIGPENQRQPTADRLAD
jgi:putative acetyltransferase